MDKNPADQVRREILLLNQRFGLTCKVIIHFNKENRKEDSIYNVCNKKMSEMERIKKKFEERMPLSISLMTKEEMDNQI